MADPILYPIPRGNADGQRQAIARARAELSETLGALSARTHVGRRTRDNAVAAVRANATVITSAAVGALAMGALGHGMARWPGARRRGMAVAVTAGAVAAVAGFATVRAHRGSASRRPRPETRLTTSGLIATALATTSSLPPSPAGGDVVDVLMAEHRQIDATFAQMAHPVHGSKLLAFAALVDLLNSHEGAEEEVVHPVLRDLGSPASGVVDARLAEEKAAKRALADLIAMGVTDRHFDKSLAALHETVRAHAQREEAEEFPLLRRDITTEQLQLMANQVRATRGDLP